VNFADRACLLPPLENPDWLSLAQHWPDGHIKLAWTRHLLKFRSELADVFTDGDYRPLPVSGPHRDHVIAFARRRGRDAAIVAVAKSFAAFSQGGRAWPRAKDFDGAINLSGYAVQGFADPDATELRLADLFAHLPVAVLRVRLTGSVKPARKRTRV
jgi:(1->4)-alpha-D-glucan 1-alpha-D-glucosylmutase